jgi:Flp pilus assembly pilin Flp
MLKLFVSLQNRVAALRDREDGQAFVEYGVLLAIVAIGMIAVLLLFRKDIADALSAIGSKLTGAVGQ